jgi:hypothetical protein
MFPSARFIDDVARNGCLRKTVGGNGKESDFREIHNNTFQGKFAFKRSLGEKELVISRVHKKTALFREEIRPNLVCSTPITTRQSPH